MTSDVQTPGKPPRGGLIGAAASIGVALAIGAVGAVATQSSVGSWYASLAKPAFNPPNAVFGPVWTALYVLMAVAAWRVWRHGGFRGASGRALGAYALQLALNLAWSVIFFGLRAPGPALAELAVLYVAIWATAILFWRLDRIAGLLMAPYIVWTTFAGVLNAAIVRLN